MPNQHVVPHGDGWAVKGEGNTRATKVTSTKKEATDAARQISEYCHLQQPGYTMSIHMIQFHDQHLPLDNNYYLVEIIYKIKYNNLKKRCVV